MAEEINMPSCLRREWMADVKQNFKYRNYRIKWFPTDNNGERPLWMLEVVTYCPIFHRPTTMHFVPDIMERPFVNSTFQIEVEKTHNGTHVVVLTPLIVSRQQEVLDLMAAIHAEIEDQNEIIDDNVWEEEEEGVFHLNHKPE